MSNVLKVSLQTQVSHLQGSLSGLISKPRIFGVQPDWALNYNRATFLVDFLFGLVPGESLYPSLAGGVPL
jgi:hypothetical protein